MKFIKVINGIEVQAEYSDTSVTEIFLPLLRKLTDLYQEKQSRVVVLLAAPPAAGKSTLAAFLHELSEKTEGIAPIQAIGMDGFHRYQDYLLTHSILRDGKERCMVDVKGCPETFDLPKLTEAMRRVYEGEEIGWPEYNRMLHNPTEDALTVDGDIVLIEGNYLLLSQPGWEKLRSYADYSIRIIAGEVDLRERLISRKHQSGTPYEKAVEFVESSDLYNVRTCLTYTREADLTLWMTPSGEYTR